MPELPWIPPHKLVPPPPPAGWIARGLPDAAVTALVAGPGWGKTGALLGLVAAAEAEGRGVIWFTADAGDEDADACFEGLVAAAQRLIPNFAPELAGPARARWAQLLGQLAAYGAPILLVIDDAQALGDEVAKGLGAALERLPPTVRLALAARRKPPFGLAKLAARGEARLLGAAELGLTAGERARVAAALGVPDPGARADALEGWPQGFALLARRRGGTGRIAENSSASAAFSDGVSAAMSRCRSTSAPLARARTGWAPRSRPASPRRSWRRFRPS